MRKPIVLRVRAKIRWNETRKFHSLRDQDDGLGQSGVYTFSHLRDTSARPGQPPSASGAEGQWQQGTVRGRLVDAGWGAALGYPGMVLDPLGPVVEVYLFESAELPDHWPRLDEFEGTGYRRVITQVRTADGELDGSM
jgi:gamma-glutamylcyclotransferase (GGCT)/AIG2-like uncharacterized protein YtfP